MRYIVHQIDVPLEEENPDLALRIASLFRLRKNQVGGVTILRKSLDSRRRGRPRWKYSLAFDFDGPLRHPRALPAAEAGQAKPGKGGENASEGASAGERRGEGGGLRGKGGGNLPVTPPHAPSGRVAVIGAGPAGMAAAFGLAEKGYEVHLFEQGSEVGKRYLDIRRFLKQDLFNPVSNILFGEGGAGAFSDGKLTSRTRNEFTQGFLDLLVRCGAPEAVTYLSHPHIGTDRLQFLIQGWRNLVLSLGARLHFDTVVDDVEIAEGRVSGLWAKGEFLPFDTVVLAMGHSARALYRRLFARGVPLEKKAFSVGMRVEHPQSLIDARQWGRAFDRAGADGRKTDAGSPDGRKAEGLPAERRKGEGLPPERPKGEGLSPERPKGEGLSPERRKAEAAEYYLAWHEAERDLKAYSFCMCPGGIVVPCADTEGEICTNGMSYSNRAGAFANSALVVPVEPRDLPEPVLAGIEYQQDLERRAFALGGGGYSFPAQTVGAFVDGRLDAALPASSFQKPLRAAQFRGFFAPKVEAALLAAVAYFDRKIPGFIAKGLFIGPETRTSSPVRILRDTVTLECTGVKGLFPLGEGAGYSGGIVSSGADGLRLAALFRSRVAGWGFSLRPTPLPPSPRASVGTSPPSLGEGGFSSTTRPTPLPPSPRASVGTSPPSLGEGGFGKPGSAAPAEDSAPSAPTAPSARPA